MSAGVGSLPPSQSSVQDVLNEAGAVISPELAPRYLLTGLDVFRHGTSAGNCVIFSM